MDLSHKLKGLDPQVCPSPWEGYEHSKGYAVMILPFSSGHLLGLRVFPENDFAPYTSVWHRSPGGDWSIYNDGPSLQTTCPRWWGAALKNAAITRIKVDWVGKNTLKVEMEKPNLEWIITMEAPVWLRLLNKLSMTMPLSSWRPGPRLRMREWMAKRVLDMGDLELSFDTPSNQRAIIMPERTYFIKQSEAILEEVDLGQPVRLEENPRIGKVPLPIRGAFIVGQAHATIKDPIEYQQTKRLVRGHAKYR